MSPSRIQLTPQFVQAVRDAVQVEELAAEHTQLKKTGRSYLGLCPFHKEKTPSLSVDPERGLYYCFGCGAGGDGFKFHQQLTGDDFPAAVEALARRYGVPIPRGPVSRRAERQERDLEAVLEAAARFFRARLETTAARRYLERRRIPAELEAAYELGYAPDAWRELHDALSPKIPVADLEAAGLVGHAEGSGRLYDRFRHRLVFPIRTPTGALVGFGGRTLGDDRAKYVNTRETERFQKGDLLYGLDRARRHIREQRRVLLVEGYFDVLGAVACGLEATVASMGTALTEQQARLLARYGDEVVLGYDGDRAGEEACRKALPLLLAQGLTVRRAVFPPGQDPDSLRLEEGPEAVLAVVAEAPDAVTREIERLPTGARDPREGASAAAALRPLLSAIPDAALRYGYGRTAAERLGLPADVLLEGAERRGGLGAPATGAAARVHGRSKEVHSLEERTLQLLLEAPGEAPSLPEEAFLDADCRSIFRALCELEGQGERAPEGAERGRAVLARLGGTGPAIDRLAQLLLQEPVQSGARTEELADCLRQLDRRFKRRRMHGLAVEIRQAEREGDHSRVERLAYEMGELARDRHGRPGQGAETRDAAARGPDLESQGK